MATNAWMLMGRAPAIHRSTAPAKEAQSARPGPSVSAPVDAAAALSPHILKLLASLETVDLASLRDEMRREGFDEATVRGIIAGTLRTRFRIKATTWKVDQAFKEWWKPTRMPLDEQLKIIDRPLVELLGHDPLDLAERELRYDFLPLEKRRLLATIDLDYAQMNLEMGPPRGTPSLSSDRDQQSLLQNEHRKDVLAALTPEERAEYELRFTRVPGAGRFGAMEATEEEFRAIKPLLLQNLEQLQALPRDQGLATASLALEQATLDEIVARIGFDRAVQYQWAGTPSHSELVMALREEGLPRENAAEILQLAAEIGIQAAEANLDPALSTEQKGSALRRLQEQAAPKLDALIPVEIREKLPRQTLGWYAALGEGTYYPPRAFFSLRMTAPPVAVSTTQPDQGPRRVPPLPRRPATAREMSR